MSQGMIALVGVIYAATAVSFFAADRPGMAIAFLGYAIGNIGLFMEA